MIIIIGSCEDKLDLLVPIPNDITFNDVPLLKYSYQISDKPFIYKSITFNSTTKPDGTFCGFAYSNQNNRSFVWTDSKQSRDTNIFSVYTNYRNMTDVFLVGCADSEGNCFFTLETPQVIEHILIANNTYNYLGINYGVNSGTIIANPNVPSAPRALWKTYIPSIARKLSNNGDYYRVVITGYYKDQITKIVNSYLCCRAGADPDNPTFNFIRTDWVRQDLSVLGLVDKVSFSTECSYKDANNKDIINSYFCLDGIRLKQ